MCGRFALYTPPARVARYFQATLAEGTEAGYTPSWNVAPTDQVLGVREHPPPRDDPGAPPKRELMSFRWGLVPWWSKDAKGASRLINARCETVATKASFREAFKERRIIVPADGFYEWHRAGGKKQPHFFARADGAPMAFAGLAERWRDRSTPDAPLIRSCSIITTRAGADMNGIHDRMPVILDPTTFDPWLDPANEDVEELRALLRPPPKGTVVHHRVDPRIGNVANNDAALIEAVAT
jgi:putative SOS response-associated peptidase YedK